jgi:hypothetical protein
MRLVHCIATLVLLCSRFTSAQEVSYLDLSTISQRTELRYPPAPAIKCNASGPCVGGGSGGGSVGDGAPDIRDPHALGIYLLSIHPGDINSREDIEVEFKVLNTGFASIELPVSPHLSDLQPSDASLPFTYSSLALAIRVEGEHPDCVPCVGYVQLYGLSHAKHSTVVLRPGEWIRVKARIALQPRPTGAAQIRGYFWLRTNTFSPHAGGGFISSNNLYPNATPTPAIDVRFLSPSGN